MPARRRRPLPLLLAALALAAAAPGCGNERAPVPETPLPGVRLGDNPLDDPKAGYSLIAPAGWTVTSGQPPEVTTIASGAAIVSLLRYPRTETLPRTKAELDRAMADLIAAAKARDPSFTVIRSARTRVDGKPAVEIRATETIAGVPRTVRSAHVYAHGAEFVVDMYAPNDDFRRIDALYFRPLLRSLELRAPTA
ncbi:hypothetical protein [Paraconexibacter sp.]|uniref:hypothetical protein n=1 Tax=Paraconexibacter sp. TaxID=2949640 RepID=UPI0035661D71